VLSSRARTLVVILFVLGGLGYVGASVAAPVFVHVQPIDRAVVAQDQTAAAFTTLEQQAQAFSTAGAHCASLGSGDAASCFEANDARFASQLDGYAGALSAIDFPDSVGPQVTAARSAADQAAQTLVHLSQLGPDLTTYEMAAANSNFQAEATQIDATTRQLSQALTALATPTDT
jgi:hypothetical protein